MSQTFQRKDLRKYNHRISFKHSGSEATLHDASSALEPGHMWCVFHIPENLLTEKQTGKEETG